MLMVTNRTAEVLGASDVGLLLTDQRGRLQFIASSNEDKERLELFEVQVHEGPCLDAFRSGRPVVNADLTDAGHRWPGFAPRAAAAGFRSVHAIPLRLRTEVIGAMGVFATDVGNLEDPDIQLVQALAHMATIGLLQERTIRRSELLTEQLQSALTSRIIIEQAKGVVAEYLRVSVEDAFLILQDQARRTNSRLAAVAQAALAHPARMRDSSDAASR
jgi:GAF domain/ANTAR domain